MGISETKLTMESEKWAFKDLLHGNNYKFFSSSHPTKPSSAGVVLIIHKKWERQIGSIEKHDGRIIAANFQTKKSKICVIQTYLPSNRTESNKYQRIIRNIITNKSSQNFHIIIMGDFNVTYNPLLDRSSPPSGFRPSWKPEIALFEFLEDMGFTDVQQQWEPDITSPTWHGHLSYSHIDYIWTSATLSDKHLISFQNERIKDITNSDHTLLFVELANWHLFQKDPITKRSKAKSRKIIDLKQTTEEHWLEYQTYIEQKIEQDNIKDRLSDILSRPNKQ